MLSCQVQGSVPIMALSFPLVATALAIACLSAVAFKLPELLGLSHSRLQDLPNERPLQPWPYKELATAQTSCVVPRAFGKLACTIEHAPLKGITIEEMLWWFRNMDGASEFSYGEQQSRKWSHSLMWHPRDHVSIRIQGRKGSDSVGARVHIQEYLLARMGYTQENTQDAKGRAAVMMEEFVSSWSILTSLDSAGCTFMSSQIPGMSLFRLRHEWFNMSSGKGLHLRSRLEVGASWFPTGFVIDGAVMGSKWTAHCVEEFGNLENFLPEVYQTSLQVL